MQLAFEFAMAAAMAMQTASPAVIAAAPRAAVAPRSRQPEAEGSKNCRFVLRAIEDYVKQFPAAGTGVSRRRLHRRRLQAGEASDSVAEQIIFAAAAHHAEYRRTTRRRAARKIVWNGETIEI